ncbi:MAG: acyl-CoA dehydrogenase family protein [Oscillospiraceae bacterium]
MDFHLSAEQEALKQEAEAYARDVLEPKAWELDRTGVYDDEHLRGAVRKFSKVRTAKKYGGLEMGMMGWVLVMEAMSYSCVATAMNLSISGTMGEQIDVLPEAIVNKYGKERLLAGEVTGCAVISEPQAGSDVTGFTTTALEDGDDYVINGKKAFITNGQAGDVYFLYALTAPELGVRKGLSILAVPRETPGITVAKDVDKLGLRGSRTPEIHFDNVRVPKTYQYGEKNRGYSWALSRIDTGRISVSAQAVGLAQRALDESIKYIKEREAFGKPLAANQALQFYIAEMQTEIEMARLLTYKAAMLRDEESPESPLYAAMAKSYAPEMALRAAQKAIQMHGANGCTVDYVVERLYRDIHALRIYDGTIEIQKLVVAKNVLKK